MRKRQTEWDVLVVAAMIAPSLNVQKKGANRIAVSLYTWRRLRKVEKEGKRNLSLVNLVCPCLSEAIEVLSAATYLDEQGGNEETKAGEAGCQDSRALKDALHISAIAHNAVFEDDDNAL